MLLIKCHRPSQTPHLRVKNANPGWRRGLVRHQLLNQSEGETEGEDGLDSESWVMLTGIKCGLGITALQCGVNPGPASLSVSGLQCRSAACVCVCVCVCHGHSLVWRMTPALTLDNLGFHYRKHADMQMACSVIASGHLACVTEGRDRLTEPPLNSHSLSPVIRSSPASGLSPSGGREPDCTAARIMYRCLPDAQTKGSGPAATALFRLASSHDLSANCWGPVPHLISMSRFLFYKPLPLLCQTRLNISCFFPPPPPQIFPGSL